MRCYTAASTVLLVVVVLATTALAEDQGRGLGRALSKLGGKSASAAPGLNKAGQNMSRLGNSMGRANGLNRAPGLARGPLARLPRNTAEVGDEALANVPKDAASRHQRQLLNEQRHRDHRLAQAQKLRELAAKNGDAELAANADRMEAQALQHYDERVQHLEKFGVTDLSLNPPQVELPPEGDSVTVTTPDIDVTIDAPSVTEPSTGEPRTASRPWWKPKWWGNK